MSSRFFRLVLFFLSTLFLISCSSPRYKEWHSHDRHFATWGHAKFSVKNTFKRFKPTKNEVERSEKEGWWGEEIPVE